MKQLSQVKPCPFCGGTGLYIDYVELDGALHRFVMCKDCGCEGPHSADLPPESLWNKRAAAPKSLKNTEAISQMQLFDEAAQVEETAEHNSNIAQSAAEPAPDNDSVVEESPLSLADLCRQCKSAHPFCDKCCAGCADQCNSSQRCHWPGAEIAPTAPAKIEPVFSRDELKIMAAGSQLVRYTRDEKKIECSGLDPAHGWTSGGSFPTYAAAERMLKYYKGINFVETDLNGKIVMSGWNQSSGLSKQGFEFYRAYGFHSFDTSFCIKVGSKNWSNLAKYPDQTALKLAWDQLMQDPKALEG